MSKTTVIAATAVALLAGVGVGVAGGAVASEPTVQTKTRTVTEEVPTTPQECLDALTAAEGLGRQMSRTLTVSMEWPDLVQRAARAGMNMDVAGIDSVTADVTSISGDYEAILPEVDRLVDDFNTAKAGCRAS